MKMRGFIAFAMALSGCVSEAPDPAGPGDGDVFIDMTTELTYAPASAQARVGQTVVWRNPSTMAHTITADPALASNAGSVSLPAGAEPFASPLVATGGSYSRTFMVVGTYRYFCQPHEGAGMIGTIVVVP
ncbi:MAG: hypothetical protein KFH98_13150 [Gemmatimonadetes bacterium]|nr:hypothetical protein [Gemmatimonadota bacterium]